MIRVLIADDHKIVRQGLRFLLSQESGIEVAGEAADGVAALEAVRALRPDVVLLDLFMPGLDGIAVLKALQADGLASGVLVLTSSQDDAHLVQAIRAGALSYLPKTADVDQVGASVRAAARGESVLQPAATARLLKELRRGSAADPLGRLTPRERDVLTEVARGRSNREIARALSVSEETVKSHVSSILAKLGLADRTQAAIFGLQRQLVPLDEALDPYPGPPAGQVSSYARVGGWRSRGEGATGYPGKEVSQSDIGLARAVRAKESGYRAGADIEARVVHRGRGSVVLDEAACLDHRNLQWLSCRGCVLAAGA